MSEMTGNGGFSNARVYCCYWPNASSRSALRPLYSQAKQPRVHTSAQRSLPESLRAARSKRYYSLVGSASAGVGSPSRRHKSMKCFCHADRPFNSEACHLVIDSPGAMVPIVSTKKPVGGGDTSRAPISRYRSSKPVSPFVSCFIHLAMAPSNLQTRMRRLGRLAAPVAGRGSLHTELGYKPPHGVVATSLFKTPLA